MITHEDIIEIERVLDERYVLQRECNDIQERNASKFANDDKRIDMILLKQDQMRDENRRMREENRRGLKFNNWLTTAVLGCIIVGIISYFYLNFGG